MCFDIDALNNGYPPYRSGEGVYFYPEQLVWIDNEQDTKPDYWDKLKHQAAIAAMQAMIGNHDYINHFIDYSVEGVSLADDVVRCANDFATALIEKLKNK